MAATKKIKIIDTDAICNEQYNAGATAKKTMQIINTKIASIKYGIVKYEGYWYPVINGERQIHHSYQFSTGAEQVLRQLMQ